MGETQRDSEALLMALREDAESHAGEHPDVDELLDYLSGEMNSSSEMRVQDHLVSCRRCTELLLEIETISNPSLPAEEGTCDLEMAASWRELKTRIDAQERGDRRFFVPRFVYAAAACLLVAFLGVSGWAVHLSRVAARLGEPQLNPPIVYLDSATRTGEGVVATLEVAAKEALVLFILTPTDLRAFTDYEVAVLDVDGQEVFRQRGLKKSDHGTLRLGLPTRLLPTGEYRIRIHGLNDGQSTPLGDFPLRISYRQHP